MVISSGGIPDLHWTPSNHADGKHLVQMADVHRSHVHNSDLMVHKLHAAGDKLKVHNGLSLLASEVMQNSLQAFHLSMLPSCSSSSM